MSTEDEDQINLTIRVGFDPNGTKCIQRVMLRDCEGEPGSYVDIVTRPDEPNSYHEFLAVTSIFTSEFINALEETMGAAVESQMMQFPLEVVEAVNDEVREGLLLQGLTAEQVSEIERRGEQRDREGSD